MRSAGTWRRTLKLSSQSPQLTVLDVNKQQKIRWLNSTGKADIFNHIMGCLRSYCTSRVCTLGTRSQPRCKEITRHNRTSIQLTELAIRVLFQRYTAASTREQRRFIFKCSISIKSGRAASKSTAEGAAAQQKLRQKRQQTSRSQVGKLSKEPEMPTWTQKPKLGG